ncbi:MAG TPA: FimV/HubP family polar landmark protein [Gallionellaceae bacterium]|nr:FimV/HubP family polar landmark protein [Gallionellaceae bacterium]
MLVLVWSNLAGAVGLGGINVTSALGRPLKAEIALVALEEADKANLAVRLASPADFKNAGVDYPYGLPKLSFEIESKANGDTYVKLTSSQPVNEPFVSLLLELSWSSGRVLREYTFLLDPEGFAPEQPKAAEVQPVEPLAPVAAASAVPAETMPPAAAEPEVAPVPVLAPAVAAVEAASAPAAAESAPSEAEPGLQPESVAAASAAQPDVSPDMEAKDLAAEAPAQAAAPAPEQKQAASKEAVTVKRGDTLGKIAAQVKPVDVSLERMVVALYHANSKEFDGRNMNRVRVGKVLRMPESDDVAKVSQAAAVKEIRAQVADWHAYRQKLAAAQGQAATEQAPKREDAGKISTAVAEKAPAAKESAKEVLKLSKGEAPGDKQIAGGALSKQDKRAAKEDDALAKKKQQQEEQKRAEELKKIGEQASKLVELKGAPAEKQTAAPVAAASATAAASAAAVAKPKPKMAAAPSQPVAAPPSLLDDLLGDPIMLGGGAAALLALGGLGFVVVRRLRNKGGKKKNELRKEFKIEPLGSATGGFATPVPPSPETGDFTRAGKPAEAAAAPAVAPADEIDPIGEAELFLNFGRDAQAEDVLKDALGKDPANIPVKLKLLSIYANRKDSNSFLKYAREIQQSGDNTAWEQAAAMGRAIDPGNPIYGGASDAAVAPTAAPAAQEPSVDFDLGLGKPAEVAAPAAKEFAMDFDVTGTHPGVHDAGAHATGGVVDVSGVLPGEVARSAQETPMDFDVSGILPNELLKSAQKAEMDFDISSSVQQTPASDETSSSMDFDVTGGNVAAKAPEAAPAMDFGDLVFEVPASSAPKEAAPAPQATPAIDLGMPFTLDFPSSGPAAAAKPAEPKLDIDFADINLDLEATAVQPRGAAEAVASKDEHWHEVATKLDLAKAYQEMGDAAGAREILDEVVREGDAEQRETAEKLLQQLA